MNVLFLFCCKQQQLSKQLACSWVHFYQLLRTKAMMRFSFSVILLLYSLRWETNRKIKRRKFTKTQQTAWGRPYHTMNRILKGRSASGVSYSEQKGALSSFKAVSRWGQWAPQCNCISDGTDQKQQMFSRAAPVDKKTTENFSLWHLETNKGQRMKSEIVQLITNLSIIACKINILEVFVTRPVTNVPLADIYLHQKQQKAKQEVTLNKRSTDELTGPNNLR